MNKFDSIVKIILILFTVSYSARSCNKCASETQEQESSESDSDNEINSSLPQDSDEGAHEIPPSPKLHKMTLSPMLHKITRSPKMHKMTLSPKLHDITVSPKLHDITVSPKLHETTLSPKLHEITFSPKLHEITTSHKSHAHHAGRHHAGRHHVKRKRVKDHNENVYVQTTDTVTERSATIENVTCKYQGNRSDEEDEYESKSTLIDYPFSVSIQKKGAHYVSGALIDKRWILTVAGEFYNVRESLKLFRARLGSVDCKRGGTLVPIKKVEIHPYYIHGKPNFDVALLRMAKKVDYSDVLRPIGISNVQGKVLSAKFMTTYWPRIVIKGQALPETAKERMKYNSMRVSTQILIPSERCTSIMAAINEFINESSLCLKPVVTHHSICMPDPGAPVIAKDGLWGITSGWISPTCPNYAAPTIFTRLSSRSVRSWLDSILLSI